MRVKIEDIGKWKRRNSCITDRSKNLRILSSTVEKLGCKCIQTEKVVDSLFFVDAALPEQNYKQKQQKICDIVFETSRSFKEERL